MIPFTLEYIKVLAVKNNCILLSNNYKNICKELKFRCCCGRVFKKSLKNFRRSPRCSICYKNELKKILSKRSKELLPIYNKHNLKYIKDYITQFEYILISKVYKNNRTKLKIQCPEGHKYEVNFGAFFSGRRCPQCAIIKRADEYRYPIKYIKDYINSFKCILLSNVYLNNVTLLRVQCNVGHIYHTTFKAFQQGYRCPICNISQQQRQVTNFIKELKIERINICDRIVINPFELDVYLPDYKLGIEYNGLYWHSVPMKFKDYHKKKQDLAEQEGIRLIQIFEDEWRDKQYVVKKVIKSVLGMDKDKVYARNCVIKEVSYKEAKQFLNDNHIQGSGRVGTIRLGLCYQNNLVFLMTFSKPSISKNQRNNKLNVYELYKQCFSIRVVGGFSKLLKYFIFNYNPIKIVSYVDRRYFTAISYLKCGFKIIGVTVPGYCYTDFNIRKHRFGYRKDRLVKLGYNSSFTERQITEQMGLHRVYDAGHIKVELII